MRQINVRVPHTFAHTSDFKLIEPETSFTRTDYSFLGHMNS